MKLTTSLLCLMLTALVSAWHDSDDELTFDVTSMVGSEDYYLQLKRKKPTLRRPPEEKLRHKEDVCLGILAQEFFDVHKVEMVNPNHKSVYKQVKQQHPNIHEEHFKSGYASSEVIKPKFANPYRLREVNVHGQKVREYMFTCLARNCSTQNIQQYFVSPEYEDPIDKWTMRFVFANDNKQGIVLLAKAVDPETIPTSYRRSSTSVTPTHKSTVSSTTEKAKSTEKSAEEESSYPEDSSESGSW